MVGETRSKRAKERYELARQSIRDLANSSAQNRNRLKAMMPPGFPNDDSFSLSALSLTEIHEVNSAGVEILDAK